MPAQETPITRTEADAIIETVKKLFTPEVVKVEDLDGTERQVVVAPAGLQLHSVKTLTKEYRTTPERREGRAALDSLESFVAWTNRHKDKGSAIFANRADEEKPELIAIIDYNHAGEEDDHGAPLARFRGHRAVYAFPLSEEWEAWTTSDGTQMTQADFAAFVEGRLADLDGGAPGANAAAFAAKVSCDFASPSRLITLSRGMSVKENATVRSVVNLQSGEGQAVFETSHVGDDGGPLAIPGAFLIAIPVFRGGPPWQIPVRLRYRLNGGRLTWWYDLYRADAVFDTAFDEACATARTETGLPLFLGRPE